MTIRLAAAAEVLDLRHAVLRAGFPREASVYDVDALPTTRHFIALDNSRVVGCATIFPQPWDGGDGEGEGHGDRQDAAWRLRGMAVADDARQGGIGRMLLDAIDEFLRSRGVPLIWCQARVPAIGFYQRCGWRVASEVFDLPPIGPHVKMIRKL